MKKALLVIDIQNDYLWDKRKKKFIYDTDKIIGNINETINKYKDEADIIYISHLINNIITNKILFGFSIKGTEGAKLYSKLNVVSNLKFDKYLGDAFTAKNFKNHMLKNNYNEVFICGLDLCGCVYHTTKGSIKNGFKTTLIMNSIACRYNDSKKEKIIAKLNSLGAKII